MSIGLLSSTIVSYFVCRFLVFDGWLSVLIRALVVLMCYVVIMTLFALNATEKEKLKGIIKTIIKL